MGVQKKVFRTLPGDLVSSVDDRRIVYRNSAVLVQGWLGWWEGPEFRNTAAQLVNISLRGCMMTVDRLPPREQPVWFCSPGASPLEWIEANLIEAKRRLFGPSVVRLAFLNPFSYETFKHVVYGPEALGGPMSSESDLPKGERDFW